MVKGELTHEEETIVILEPYGCFAANTSDDWWWSSAKQTRAVDGQVRGGRPNRAPKFMGPHLASHSPVLSASDNQKSDGKQQHAFARLPSSWPLVFETSTLRLASCVVAGLWQTEQTAAGQSKQQQGTEGTQAHTGPQVIPNLIN
jgi:hypothetical protein